MAQALAIGKVITFIKRDIEEATLLTRRREKWLPVPEIQSQ